MLNRHDIAKDIFEIEKLKMIVLEKHTKINKKLHQRRRLKTDIIVFITTAGTALACRSGTLAPVPLEAGVDSSRRAFRCDPEVEYS